MDKRKCFSISLIAIFCSLICVLSSSAFATEETESEILSADKAFILQITPIKKNNLTTAKIHFNIAPHYALYQEHFKFRRLNGQPIPEKNITLPPALVKKEGQEEYKIYKKEIEILVALDQADSGLRIQYQGCGEMGFCYPPVSQELRIVNGSVQITKLSPEAFETVSTKAVTQTLVGQSSEQSSTPAAPDEPESEVDHITDFFQGKSILSTLAAFLGLGLLLAFTPCVLPMVPILANILVGQQQPLSRKRSFTLSGLYVLSMAACYALAGLAAGLLGSHLSTTLQQPLILVSLSFLLLLFALSQFNVVQVQLPLFLTGTLKRLEIKHHHQGSALGAIGMGAISALVASPCVTPALVGALTYIGQTGDALLGGLALFFLALGMGLPLLMAACIGSHLLPKAGAWMKYIKNITGLLLVGLAGSILWRAVPLTSNTAVASTAAIHDFTPVHSVAELKEALKLAETQKKPVLLDVYADWCVSCRQMDKEVFEDKQIQAQLKGVQLLRLDLTQQTQASKHLQKELGIVGPPMVLFFWPDGQEATSYRLAGKPKSANFSEMINRFLEKSSTYHCKKK